jgi:ribonuclease P protein component
MQRRFRLRRSADFELLYRHGQRWQHPLLLLIVRANGRQVSRFGFSAGRRVGKAAQRNRAKRRLRESVRARMEEIRPGWDCLLIARRPLIDAPFEEVATAVAGLFQRAGLLLVENEKMNEPDAIRERFD